MKSAILCANCDKLTRFSDSYAMRIQVYANVSGDPTRERLKMPEKVRVCKTCAKKAGYKVPKPKKSQRISPKEDRKRKGSTTVNL